MQGVKLFFADFPTNNKSVLVFDKGIRSKTVCVKCGYGHSHRCQINSNYVNKIIFKAKRIRKKIVFRSFNEPVYAFIIL